MKYCFTLLAALLFTLDALAQTPQRFSYQAVVRSGLHDELLKDRQVLVRVSILEQTATGPAVYVEEHTPTTNENGLLTIQIGGGTVVSGAFATIDWAKGVFFLETQIDPEGREITPSAITGVSQLLSVPYAIYAQQADSSRHALYADSVRGHQIGDFFDGGIIFALWRDRTGKQHGLIASLDDLESKAWAEPEIESASVGASYRDGAVNTAAIVAAGGSNTAAGACDAYVVLNSNLPPYTDWYLPAAWELNLLYAQVLAINTILDGDNDPFTNGLNKAYYWSSTRAQEYGNNSQIVAKRALSQIFQQGNDLESRVGILQSEDQDEIRAVRAVRRF